MLEWVGLGPALVLLFTWPLHPLIGSVFSSVKGNKQQDLPYNINHINEIYRLCEALPSTQWELSKCCHCYMSKMADHPERKPVRKHEAWPIFYNQMDVTNTHRTFHPTAAQCTFLWSAHRIFSRIDHMLGHKRSLNTFEKTGIMSIIFPDHNDMKLELSNKKIGKFTHI